MKNTARYFACGLAMGAADVVPGVSGGTIAFITGIYPRLLDAIETFDVRFFRLVLRLRLREACGLVPWDFLLPLVCGIALSIFSLAKGVLYLLAVWPIIIWAFFFGLILASIFVLGQNLDLRQGRSWAALALGAIAGWFVGGAESLDMGHSLPVCFFSGYLAICAMILPGISGAFVLVLLGQYAYIIGAVAHIDLGVLAVFALGCLCGLMSFARVLNALLKRYPSLFMALLTGLMLGSLRTIWPWHDAAAYPCLPPALNEDVAVALLCCAAGMALPLALNLLPRFMEKRT